MVMLKNSDFILKAMFTQRCKDREGGARDGENRKQWKKKSEDGKSETTQRASTRLPALTGAVHTPHVQPHYEVSITGPILQIRDPGLR